MRKIEQIITEYCNECNEEIRSINIDDEGDDEYELCFSCERKQLENKQRKCKHNMEFYEFAHIMNQLIFTFKCSECKKEKTQRHNLSYIGQNKIGKLLLDNKEKWE